jgi:hypothetical protein
MNPRQRAGVAPRYVLGDRAPPIAAVSPESLVAKFAGHECVPEAADLEGRPLRVQSLREPEARKVLSEMRAIVPSH